MKSRILPDRAKTISGLISTWLKFLARVDSDKKLPIISGTPIHDHVRVRVLDKRWVPRLRLCSDRLSPAINEGHGLALSDPLLNPTAARGVERDSASSSDWRDRGVAIVHSAN